jgi:hypothetical protein
MTTAELGRNPEEDLIAKVREELNQSPLADLEFPVSSMSLQLAKVLKGLASPNDNYAAALDVGTGCGIHSFVLNQRGFNPVLAIDSNERAIVLACNRGVRLGIDSRLTERAEIAAELLEDNATTPRVLFSSISLQDLEGLVASKFQLIAFNPPAFFFVRDTDLSCPAASGVYAGDARRALDVDQGLLFQFFGRIVLPLLAPGGEVICTWPGIERRAVEINPVSESRSLPAHPASLIESWFDVIVDCKEKDVDRFYQHTVVINFDYGLGGSFWHNLDHALQNPRCYSTLVKSSDWRHGSHPTFRFGILRLRRSGSDASHFESICV